ncbi:opioid growth factor receptor-like protein 1 [Hyperolius riggenbachi]|uniref:opioid growth factor receptor-like protein 1 n=1 Tax=Hyperolius riggenbachi TaxID=752182 RepID=UPI0035A31E9A
MSSYYSDKPWDNEYDSTWEDDEEPKTNEKIQKDTRFKSYSWNSAAKDLQRYRHGYPEDMPNLWFYQNKIPFEPNGCCIEEVYQHNHAGEKYRILETKHDYIQWLFPLREPGLNAYAKPLTKDEIQMMKNDPEVMKRFLKSYILMLEFYGITLVDKETGKVNRAENWEERFHNLNTYTHNNLRITRILKCLGEFGYERFQAALVSFFLQETLCCSNLHNVKRSALDYFMFTVKNKAERRKLVLFAWQNYEPQDKFIWGPVEKLRRLTGKFHLSEDNMKKPVKEDGEDEWVDRENDIKEPGKENREDDQKETEREDRENDIKEPGKENREDNQKETEREDSENEIKEPGKENREDNQKETEREDSENDIKEPGKENREDDQKETEREDSENEIKEPGKENREDNQKETEREDSENDIKEPGKETSEDDQKETEREDSENDIKEPGKENREDNQKETEREDSENDIKEPGKENREDNQKETEREDSENDIKEPGKETSEDD